MHIKKATILAVVTFMGIHLAEAKKPKPKIFGSDHMNATTAPILKECLSKFLDQAKSLSTLHCKHVFSTNNQIGQQHELQELTDDCGDWFWQVGEEGNWHHIAGPTLSPDGLVHDWMCEWPLAKKVVEKCKKDAFAAATRGAEWFKCALRRKASKHGDPPHQGRHEAVIAWSLKSFRSCPFEDKPLQLAMKEDCPGAPQEFRGEEPFRKEGCTKACHHSFLSGLCPGPPP